MSAPRKCKKLIYVFCEGESEQAYINFLKKRFEKIAVIKPPQKGLFEVAKNKFTKDPRYKEAADVTDEIWFFMDIDTEQGDLAKWESRYKIIKTLRKLRKSPKITIRLLMTTACIEYWFMLHYSKLNPPIKTKADKDDIQELLLEKVPSYKKGDKDIIVDISQNYKEAIKNGRWTIEMVLQDWVGTDGDYDARNKWLYESGKTFTTVHEAIEFLQSMDK